MEHQPGHPARWPPPVPGELQEVPTPIRAKVNSEPDGMHYEQHGDGARRTLSTAHVPAAAGRSADRAPTSGCNPASEATTPTASSRRSNEAGKLRSRPGTPLATIEASRMASPAHTHSAAAAPRTPQRRITSCVSGYPQALSRERRIRSHASSHRPLPAQRSTARCHRSSPEHRARCRRHDWAPATAGRRPAATALDAAPSTFSADTDQQHPPSRLPNSGNRRPRPIAAGIAPRTAYLQGHRRLQRAPPRGRPDRRELARAREDAGYSP